MVIIRCRVQFVINLRECVFQKAKVARVSFLKNLRVQINHKWNAKTV